MGDRARTEAFLAGRLGFNPGERVAVVVPGRGLRYVQAENLETVLRQSQGSELATYEEANALAGVRREAALDEGAGAAVVAAIADSHGAPAIARALGYEEEADLANERIARARRQHPVATGTGEVLGLAGDVIVAEAASALVGPVAQAAIPARIAQVGGRVLPRLLTPGGLGVGAREVAGAGARRLVSRLGWQTGREALPAIAGDIAEAGVYGAAREAIDQLNQDEELGGQAIAGAFGVNALYGGVLSGGFRGVGAMARMLRRGPPGGTGLFGSSEREGLTRLQNGFLSGGPDGALAEYRAMEQSLGLDAAEAARRRMTIASFNEDIPFTPEGMARMGEHLAQLSPEHPNFRQAAEGFFSRQVRRVGEVTADPRTHADLGLLARGDVRRLVSASEELTAGVEDAARVWQQLDDLVENRLGTLDDLAIRRGLIPDGPASLSVRNATRGTVRNVRRGITEALTATRAGRAVLDQLPVSDKSVGALMQGALETLDATAQRLSTKGITGAQAFKLMNEAKRKLREGVRALSNDPTIPRDEAAAVRHIYEALSAHLQDEGVWGAQVALLQREGNAAFSRSLQQQEQLQGMLGANVSAGFRSRDRRITAAKIRSWVMATGDAGKANQVAQVDREVQGYFRQLHELERAFRSVGEEAGLEGTVNRLTAHLRVLKSAGQVQRASENALRLGSHANAGGGLVASLAGGALVGGVPGAVGGVAARALWQAATHPAQVLTMLGGVEQAAYRINRTLNRGLTSVRGAAASGVPASMPRPPMSLVPLFTADHAEREERFNEMAEEVERLSNNPQALLARLGDATRPLEDAGESGMARESAMTAMRALALMQTKLAQPPGPPSLFQGPIRRSQAEMDSALRSWWAVNDPMSLVQMVAAGRVFPEHVEAVKLVYPRLYQEISIRLLQEVHGSRRGPLQVPYWMRLSIGEATGTPADPSESASFLAVLQQRSAQTSAQADALGMGHRPASRPGRLHIQEGYPSGGSELEGAL